MGKAGITRMVIMIAAMEGLLVLVTPSSQTWGLEVAAAGGYLDESTKQRGSWQGRFLVGGSRLEGSVTLSGPYSLQDARVEGTLQEDWIDFSFVGDAVVSGSFRGQRTGTVVRGNLTIEERVGSWEGTWNLVPGGPPPVPSPDEEARQRATMSQADLTEIAEQPPQTEATEEDPLSVCRLLGNQRTVARMSRAHLHALEGYCGWKADANRERFVSLRDRLRSAIPFLWSPLDLMLQTDPVLAQSPPANILVNSHSGDPYPHITQNNAAIGVSGSNQQFLVSAFNDSASSSQVIGYASSSNQGSLWQDRGVLPAPPGGVVDGDEPSVLSNSAGNFYVIAGATDSQVKSFIGVWKSTDSGATFSVPADSIPGGSLVTVRDRPSGAADRRATGTGAGNVYTCWTDFPASGPFRVQFVRLTTQGFDPPKALISPVANVDDCSLAVGLQGWVWLSYSLSDPNDPVGSNRNFYVRRSTDGGSTFGSTSAFIATAYPPLTSSLCDQLPTAVLNGNVEYNFRAYLAADPLDGNFVYAVWNDTVGKSIIKFSSSSDGGLHWLASPIRIGTSVPQDQFFPRIATGIFYENQPQLPQIKIAWYDRRNDPNNSKVDVYVTNSFTHGATWQSESRWTDVSSPLPPLNPNFDNFERSCSFGRYISLFGLNPTSSLFVGGWGDTRLPHPLTGVPDPDIRSAVGC